MIDRYSARLLTVLTTLIFVFGSCTSLVNAKDAPAKVQPVVITDKGSHYEVVMDFRSGASHRQMGEAYAKAIVEKIPSFEALTDSYLSDLARGNDPTYMEFLRRVGDVQPQIPSDYRDEIEGMASVFSGKTTNVRGDGKLSVGEVYLLNLLPDVARGCQCNALGVFGQRSETKKTILERTLDWHRGSKNQAAQLHAVVTIRNGDKSVCLIGYLGFVGVVSGFNDDGVFAAILDAPTGAAYSSTGKRSYPMDIRYALENQKTLKGVADYMSDSAKAYSFNHLIVLGDANTTAVLENSLTGKRALRTDSSKLQPGISWEYPNAVAVVNAFLLEGNTNNFAMYGINEPRWNSFKAQLKAKGDVVSVDEVKQVASFYTGAKPGEQPKGDLYNRMTQQIMVFQPATLTLEMFFCPQNGELPPVPNFVQVPVSFK